MRPIVVLGWNLAWEESDGARYSAPAGPFK